jgi:hypothetical protein
MPPSQGRHLTLLVPGLFGPAVRGGGDVEAARAALTAGLDLAAAETLLSRGRGFPSADGEHSPEDLLFACFGHDKAPGSDWPVAAVTYRSDMGDPGDGWWIRADPVHLRPDMGDLILFDGDQLGLSRDEATTLGQAVARHFEASGWRLEVPHPLRWYLRLDAPARIATTPLSMARSAPVSATLPEGADAADWHRRLNEVQMALHGCEVNQERESRGDPEVNSLWFWGGGVLPSPRAAAWSKVFGRSAVLRGLAAAGGVESAALPAGGEAWLSTETDAGQYLVAIEDGHPAVRDNDVEAWRAFAEALSRDWFGPLSRAVEKGRLQTLSVVTDNMRYEMRPVTWWQRLRRRRSFSALAGTTG